MARTTATAIAAMATLVTTTAISTTGSMGLPSFSRQAWRRRRPAIVNRRGIRELPRSHYEPPRRVPHERERVAGDEGQRGHGRRIQDADPFRLDHGAPLHPVVVCALEGHDADEVVHAH